MLPLFVRDAQPLAVQCQTFCARFAAILETETRVQFLEFAIGELAKAGWAARRIVAPLASSVAPLLPPGEAAIIHGAIRERLTDPVRAVIAGAMGPLGRLRQFWALKGEEELGREVIAMFTSVRNSKDELILAAWRDAWEGSITKGSISALPKLPQSATHPEERKKATPAPLKAVASLQAPRQKPSGLLRFGALGKARRRTFQMSDPHGETVGAASYSGPGLAGPKLTEPALSMLGGPLLIGPGMGGRRVVKGAGG
jgi:hypothetical protein